MTWPARQRQLPAGPAPVGVHHVSTSTVASPRAARPAPPPARHGTCKWTVYIAPAGQSGGKFYAVIPLGAQPGFKGTWRLKAHDTQTTVRHEGGKGRLSGTSWNAMLRER